MKTIIVSFALAFALPALAALPNSKSPSSDLAQEILAMPEANRNQIAQTRADEIFPQLIEISRNVKQSMSSRWKALTLAALIGKEKALPEIQSALNAKEWYMRNAALIALRIHHPLKAQQAARRLLKDKALVVRSAAVEVLGSELDRQTRDLLWEEMNSSRSFRKKQSLWIRGQILTQLAAHPEGQEKPLFLSALKENEKSLNAQAILALESLTQQKLGVNSKLAEKRELWLNWAKAQNQRTVR